MSENGFSLTRIFLHKDRIRNMRITENPYFGIFHAVFFFIFNYSEPILVVNTGMEDIVLLIYLLNHLLLNYYSLLDLIVEKIHCTKNKVFH